MIVLAEPYLRFTQSIPRARLEPAATALLADASAAVRQYYASRHGSDFVVDVSVRVELGSTKTWVTVAGIAGALLFYGNVRSSIDYMLKDADKVAEIVAPFVPTALSAPKATPAYREARKGVPGQLHRLFNEVRRGDLSADEATHRAVELIYEQTGPSGLADTLGLTEQLSTEFRDESKKRSRRRRKKVPAPDNKPLAPPTVAAIATRFRSGIIATTDPLTGKVRLSTY